MQSYNNTDPVFKYLLVLLTNGPRFLFSHLNFFLTLPRILGFQDLVYDCLSACLAFYWSEFLQ